MSGQSAAPGRTPWWWYGLAGIALWFAVDPRGDFPLNDDWAFTSPVRHLLQEGRLVLSDWTSPLALPHLLTGFLLSKVFGFSHTVLRVGTWLWALAGAWLLDGILAREGAAPGPRRLAAGLLLFHPIYFVLGFTFHTDVPFVALALGALYFFLRADDAESPRDELIASAFCLGAALTRQIGLALPMSATLLWLWKKKATPGRLARTWVLPALGMAAAYAWLIRVHGPTWAHVNYVTEGTWEHLTDTSGFLLASAKRTLESLLYTSLFGISFLAFKHEKARPSFRAAAVLLAAMAAIGAFTVSRGLLPYLENVFHPRGLGTLTVYEGNVWKPALLWDRVWLWRALTAGSAVALWVFIRRAGAARPSAAEGRLLLFAAPLALATLAGAKYFDRYLLEWHLAFLLFFAVRYGRQRAPSDSVRRTGATAGADGKPGRPLALTVPPLAWAGLALWAVASVAGTRDYFAWNRAKWRLGLEAQAYGLAPAEVANGFDWNAHWTYETNMAALKARKPLAEIREWEWQAMNPARAVITYSPDILTPEHRLAALTYTSPLSPRGATLYLYAKEKKH